MCVPVWVPLFGMGRDVASPVGENCELVTAALDAVVPHGVSSLIESEFSLLGQFSRVIVPALMIFPVGRMSAIITAEHFGVFVVFVGRCFEHYFDSFVRLVALV